MANNEGGFVESAVTLGRNFNLILAVGANVVALIIPGPNVLIASYATWNYVQAGGFEILRRVVHKES